MKIYVTCMHACMEEFLTAVPPKKKQNQISWWEKKTVKTHKSVEINDLYRGCKNN